MFYYLQRVTCLYEPTQLPVQVEGGRASAFIPNGFKMSSELLRVHSSCQTCFCSFNKIQEYSSGLAGTPLDDEMQRSWLVTIS